MTKLEINELRGLLKTKGWRVIDIYLSEKMEEVINNIVTAKDNRERDEFIGELKVYKTFEDDLRSYVDNEMYNSVKSEEGEE